MQVCDTVLFSVCSQYICHLLTLQIKKPAKHPYFPNQKGSKALILRTQGQGTSRYRKSGWISFSYVTCATNSAVTIKKFLSFVCTFHKRNRKEPWIESHPSSTLPQTPLLQGRSYIPSATHSSFRCSKTWKVFLLVHFFFHPRSKPCSFRVALFISGFVDIKIYLWKCFFLLLFFAVLW